MPDRRRQLWEIFRCYHSSLRFRPFTFRSSLVERDFSSSLTLDQHELGFCAPLVHVRLKLRLLEFESIGQHSRAKLVRFELGLGLFACEPMMLDAHGRQRFRFAT